MPELPEVEVIRLGLQHSLTGRSINKIKSVDHIIDIMNVY